MEDQSLRIVGQDPEHLHHLIIFAHPYSESLSAAYVEEITSLTQRYNGDVIVRDLNQIGFYPVLTAEELAGLRDDIVAQDVETEKEYIRWADLISFVHPIWWGGMPAILKGYIDRVFHFGFAYSADENGPIGLLTDKKVVIINNMGSPYEYYDKIGMIDSMKMVSEFAIFEFCGMKVVEHHFFGNAATAPRNQTEGYIKALETIYHRFIGE